MIQNRPPLVHIIQTCMACPSQWDAWDADGHYYYLRYRCGRGTVDVCADGPRPDSPHQEFVDVLDRAVRIAEFRHGEPLDGYLVLADFLELAGLERLPITEAACPASSASDVANSSESSPVAAPPGARTARPD